MLRPLSIIFQHVRQVRRVWCLHGRLIELQQQFDRAPNPASKAIVADQIANRTETQANYLEGSWLARATTFLPPPAEIRDAAAEWRRRSAEAWRSARA